MVPVGGGLLPFPLLFAGFFFDRFAAFFTGFFAAFLTAFFAAFFLAMPFSPLRVVRLYGRLPAHVEPLAIPVVVPNTARVKFKAALRDIALRQQGQGLAEARIAA